ncbi:MAG TPA: ABC transporter permease [Pirellulales bacterium]|nr:ABC transporter permease [Pirellulales bacterium]
MASESRARHFDTPFHILGRWVLGFVTTVGDLSLFTARMLRWMVLRLPKRAVLLQSFYQIGVLSVPVVVNTGAFIGLVLAVQTYDQLHLMRLDTQLGAVINLSLVRELGPVLAATMLAGRVGSAMAAEIGTMRVTEQIDALRTLGADPIQYLVVPRFLGCCLLIPLLSALADLTGVFSGWFISTQIFEINDFHYWLHSRQTVSAYDIYCGLLKSMFFGAAIAIVSCHRGFHCSSGAQGVGQAATQAFVTSFAAILVLDFVLAIFMNDFYYVLWPSALGGP